MAEIRIGLIGFGIVIVLFAKTPRELVTALQLTLLSALLFGVGLGAALLLPTA